MGDHEERGLQQSFDRPGLSHALIGGQAVNAWISPRETDDFDFIVSGTRAVLEALERDLLAFGLVLQRRQDPGSSSGPDFVRLSSPSRTLAVDLQVAKTDYQELVIRRACPTAETGFNVASPEDLIVLKLIAMRGQDQRDVALLIEAFGDGLDWGYIEQWASVWQVNDRLALLRGTS